MNIKSYTNESLQVDDDEKESKLATTATAATKTTRTTHSEHKEVGAKAAHVVVVVVDEAKAELLHNQQQQQQQHHNKDKTYVATAATTTTAATAKHLNIEAIEKAASMVAINNNDGDNDKDKDNNCSNNNNNNSSSSNSGCNKIKKPLRQRRISLSENHNKYSHDNSHSNIDVQTFTNTKELNQVNLNSSSTTTATSQSLLSTSLEAASATTITTAAITTTKSSLATATVAEISQQQQQLIMSPTAGSSSTTPATATTTASSAVHLRKSHSTPALKFAGNSSSHSSSNHIVVEYDQCTINNNNKNDGCKFKTQVESAMEASNIAIKDVAVAAHLKRQQQHHQQPLQHEQLQRLNGNNDSNKCNTTIDATKPATPESLRFGCTHYKRRAMFVTPCCNKFYKCRFCHDENESHHFDRKTLTELICSECNTRQKVQEQCENCGVRFGKYTCLICNLFDDADKQQYHCHGCGICRIGGAHNFFHCEVCNMCLPIQLKIDGHRCVENISRSHCPVCLGDIHTSRIPCHIPDCGHLLHKMCFDQLLASGHYTCPTCQTSLIDMTALWEYLDAQALRMPVPLKYENQRVHIFCNDCHKTSKTKFHFIGLKCVHCGAYNTTQDVKRRLSLVTDEPTTA
ncbi:probable serine/threonine-protein kinase DDB_G0278665 [Drosophila albomicans]|uniref:Probable serine/threonine-protein kinase DDB_G0278665 n=1 Tax=Drosophila albomicans TaxID=7291 RepID=A0A6P8WE89_DROAB|nr:probable serine/threonine-protein kinase DDB_G0278665 [Drosophila albomicans]XP_051857904.1 probable serine/threonine-protein kinase DDB_G0278665 [Drosophila albomicans]